MTIWSEIKKIKSKVSLRALASRLEELRRVETKHKFSAGYAKTRASMDYTENGTAYWRDVCLTHANGIVGALSQKGKFIKPSGYGRSVAGHSVSYVDLSSRHAAECLVIDIIKKI